MIRHYVERTLVALLIGWSLWCVHQKDMVHASYWLIMAGMIEIDDFWTGRSA